MKKILTHLTGIVVIITILVAGSCKQPLEQNGTADKENKSTFGAVDRSLLGNDSIVEIYLKDTLQLDGRVHLKMYDSNDSTWKVVDSLYTVVKPGYTVYWMNAKESNIKEVLNIRPIEKKGKLFREEAEEIELMGNKLYKYKVPSIITPPVTEKYEIVFTVKVQDGEDEKETTWCIDPYLRIED